MPLHDPPHRASSLGRLRRLLHHLHCYLLLIHYHASSARYLSLPLYPERQYSYLIFPIPPTALVALVAAIRELDMLVISEPSEIWLLHKLFLRTIIPPATVKVQSINQP